MFDFLPSNMKLLLGMGAGVISLLVWRYNPIAIKKRKIAKVKKKLDNINQELATAEEMTRAHKHDKKNFAMWDDRYRELYAKRLSILDELANISG